MTPRIYPSSRDRILDAAERVLLRDGLTGLNVNAVVREAKLSKGGFFHHFESKEALLAAITERLARLTEAQIDEGAHDGSRLSAQVQMAFDRPAAEQERLRALVLVLIAAAMENKKVAAQAREANKRSLDQAASEGVPFGRALVIQVALDGYWLAESLGTIKLDEQQKKAFRDALLEMATPTEKADK